MEKKMKNKAPKSTIGDSFKRFRMQLGIQIFVMLGIVFLLIFSYLPMFGILMAFKKYSINDGIAGIFTSEWAGLKYFKEFVFDTRFPELMRNTILLSGLKLIFIFPIPILLAIILNECKAVGFRRFVQTASYLPHFISWVLVYNITFAFFSENTGVVNIILVRLGILDKAVPFMTGPKYFLPMAVALAVWKTTGWSAIIFLAAISGVDPTLYEAASIDGAGRIRRILHITFPGIKGAVITILILSIGNLFRPGGTNFEQSYLFGNALNSSTSEIIQTYAFKMGLANGRFSYATAVDLFQSLIAIMLIMLSNFVAKKTTGTSIY